MMWNEMSQDQDVLYVERYDMKSNYEWVDYATL
jgi:hypothetical protein